MKNYKYSAVVHQRGNVYGESVGLFDTEQEAQDELNKLKDANWENDNYQNNNNLYVELVEVD